MTVIYRSAASSSNVAFTARYWSAFVNQAPTAQLDNDENDSDDNEYYS